MKCVKKSIFPCFETIKVIDGVPCNIEYHQKRFEKTTRDFDCYCVDKKLRDFIDAPKNGVFRVKIEYSDDILNVTCRPYEKRVFQKFAIVESDIKYGYKACDRKDIDALFCEGFDDVIIMQNTILKDTSIANIALHVKGVWYTPKQPLLKGTTRQRLLENGFLVEADLDEASIKKADNFAIMNALIGFLPIENALIKRI
ncbi:MAG: aminotransferase class IV [Sulfurospirillaceae bacterium]|nr:aminotransferase class IV [Sulfurospirillaceae bacterium]